jgi:hypothetical protein
VASTSDPSAVSSPDWNAIAEQILCPMCQYNLRGLGEPRCPECGYRFAWEEMLDPRRRLHSYLFEHHPERNLRSLIRTLCGGLLPQRFWSTLHPNQLSNVRRLVIYGLLIGGISLLLPAGLLALQTAALAQIAPRASVVSKLRTGFSMAIRFHGGLPVLYGAFLFWPWLTFLTLMVFRASMRRASIRNAHMLRCAIYACDVFAWHALFMFLMGMARVAAFVLQPGAGDLVSAWLVAAVMLAWIASLLIVLLYRLTVACRLYLRFDHAFLTALSVMIIVFLAIFTAMLSIGLAIS